MQPLAGKIALVTGGTRGIGFGIARRLLQSGATVMLSGTSRGSVEVALEKLRPEGDVTGYVSDLSQSESGAALVASATERSGRIDVLVNNAGIATGSSVWDISVEEWDRVHNTNLRSTFFVSQAAAKLMSKQKAGSIVNVSSIAGQNGGLAASPSYASAKAAIIGLTRSLARRLAEHGIRVNCVAPSDIETDATAGWPQNLRDRLNAITPLGRFGSAEEVSGAVTFLASDDASYITGQTLSINGGAYLG